MSETPSKPPKGQTELRYREALPGHEWLGKAVTMAKNRSDGGPNEDGFYSNPSKGVFAVFDGVGGEPGADEASSIAARTLGLLVESTMDTIEGDPEVEIPRLMNDWVEVIKQIMSEEAGEDARKQLMCTTMTLAVAREGRLYILSLGDSRLYRKQEDGMVYCETLDQTPTFDELVTTGKSGVQLNQEECLALQSVFDSLDGSADIAKYAASTDDELRSKYGFNEDGIRVFRRFRPEEMITIAEEYFDSRRYITSSLGPGKPKSRSWVYSIELKPDDEFILTTDGVHDNLTIAEIMAIWNGTYLSLPRTKTDPIIVQAIKGEKDPERAIVLAARARSTVRRARSKRDDITVVRFWLRAVEAAKKSSFTWRNGRRSS